MKQRPSMLAYWTNIYVERERESVYTMLWGVPERRRWDGGAVWEVMPPVHVETENAKIVRRSNRHNDDDNNINWRFSWQRGFRRHMSTGFAAAFRRIIFTWLLTDWLKWNSKLGWRCWFVVFCFGWRLRKVFVLQCNGNRLKLDDGFMLYAIAT